MECLKDLQKKTILFVRHGKAVSDPDVYDADEDRSLTVAGREAAANIATQVALFAPQRLICSNSLRARQTAQYLAEKTGLAPEEMPELGERIFHGLVGMTREQIAGLFGADVLYAVEHCSDMLELPNEETLLQAKERVRVAISHVLNGPSSRLAIVSHGGPHGWLLESELGLGTAHSRLFRLDEASFSVLELIHKGSCFWLHRILAVNTRTLPMGLAQVQPAAA